MPIDDYLANVIKVGDEGSALLGSMIKETTGNSRYISFQGGLPLVNVPQGKHVVVYSVAGDSNRTNVEEHARSMVDKLMTVADQLVVEPVGFANIIDSSTGNIELITKIRNQLVAGAHEHQLAILNGENAILGNRITKDANVVGTMIALSDRPQQGSLPVPYTSFNPQGQKVIINSDGIGTKTYFYELADLIAQQEGAPLVAESIFDFLAMTLDDTVKFGARARVSSAVFEYSTRMDDFFDRAENIYSRHLTKRMQEFCASIKCKGLLHAHDARDRIASSLPAGLAYHISGSAVSTISRKRLVHPLVPQEGDVLIAMRGKPNPRSNGISSKRKAMDMLSSTVLPREQWYMTQKGQHFLEYLRQPSLVFYPIVSPLLEQGIATAFYHNSGGAYNGKLGKPIAKLGLHVNISDMFEPDSRELKLKDGIGMSVRDAYSQWPMGNDGFIAVTEEGKVHDHLRKMNVQSRTVGEFRKASESEKPGIVVETYNGQEEFFDGS